MRNTTHNNFVEFFGCAFKRKDLLLCPVPFVHTANNNVFINKYDEERGPSFVQRQPSFLEPGASCWLPSGDKNTQTDGAQTKCSCDYRYDLLNSRPFHSVMNNLLADLHKKRVKLCKKPQNGAIFVFLKIELNIVL